MRLLKYYRYVGLIAASLMLASCSHFAKKPSKVETKSVPLTTIVTNSEQQPAVSPAEKVQSGQTVTIRAIGDILVHDTVFYDAATEQGYSFDKMFEPVKQYIENADITIANLETIAAGEAIGLNRTYPLFNAPSEIIDTLKNYLGVDIVNNATNHTMDYGVEGALASIQALKQRDMLYVGSYENWNDYNTPRIIEKNGIKVGFLSYAYDTNGNYLPEEQRYLTTLIDTNLMPLEVEALNNQVDVSVVMVHNGEEYEPLPVPSQFKINNILRNAGANFILGGHPHVPEPFIYYNDSQAGIFSHGNFLSGQYEVETKLGGITEVVYRKHSDGTVTVDKMRFMPTYNFGLPETPNYLVVPLADYDKYNIPNGAELYDMIQSRMTYYTNKVEVVGHLD